MAAELDDEKRRLQAMSRDAELSEYDVRDADAERHLDQALATMTEHRKPFDRVQILD
ncbi:MAG: hypothetical protein ACRDQ4_08780 [Pseudonocardiaceae bacterium]